MMVDLNETELEEISVYYQEKATLSDDYDTVARCVKMVEKLTRNKIKIVPHKVVVNKFTDVPLSYHYNTATKKEYCIDKFYSKDGHLICRGRPLKLTIPQIISLKEMIQDEKYILETQKDWIQLSKLFGVNWMVLQRYCYNLDIGTFDKWIQKFLDKHNCQTTLEEAA